MTEDEFWEWVATSPRDVGAALLVTLEALKVGADLALSYSPESERTLWANNARKVLDAFGTT